MQTSNPAPTLSYDSIYKTLKAPKGKRWNYDPGTKQWSLVAAEKPANPSPVAVNAVVVAEDETENHKGATVTTAAIIDKDPSSPYLEHRIEPSDTFQGICLRYKITPLELRRANGSFTGENLCLVPSLLRIPRSEPTAMVVEGASGLTQSDVTGILLRECRGMVRSEARAYLMLSDWDLDEALENAREDGF